MCALVTGVQTCALPISLHTGWRRPLPEERPPTEAEQNGEEIADIVQIPERLVEQPDLTRHVWIFFHHYGRSLDEIARRLGISRRRAKRLRERAEYAIHGEPYPSLAFHIRFALMRQRLSLRSEEHTSELQSLMRTSYAVFRLQI